MREKAIAILCSDLHLSLRPPVARAGEPDWLEAQARPLRELARLSKDNDKAPILCSGDIFDRWNSPPELINWAIENLPDMYTIPGQHDLPFHRLDLLDKSAYMTLVKSRKLTNLVPGELHGIQHVEVGAFPWGVPLQPPERPARGGRTQVALIHRYVWVMGKSYPGAPEDSRVGEAPPAGGDGWNVLCYGDNHKGFHVEHDTGTSLFNCGTLLRRKSDEVDYKPQVGLLYPDGSLTPHCLDIKDDILTETEAREPVEDDMELKDFLEELSKLQDSSLDFEEAMKQVLEERKPRPAVRELVLKAMEGKT